MANNKTNEAIVLTMGNKHEIIRTSAVRKLVAYPTHYLLVVHDGGNQPESYILDATAFEEKYLREYGPVEDEALQRELTAAALFLAVVTGGQTWRILGAGVAAELQEPTA